MSYTYMCRNVNVINVEGWQKWWRQFGTGEDVRSRTGIIGLVAAPVYTILYGLYVYRIISSDVIELRCALTVSVGRSQLNFNFPDATNFYRNRLGTSVPQRWQCTEIICIFCVYNIYIFIRNVSTAILLLTYLYIPKQ